MMVVSVVCRHDGRVRNIRQKIITSGAEIVISGPELLSLGQRQYL